MSNLFTEIDDTLAQIGDGWCTTGKAHLLASSILITRPSLVVEIGVWAGRSLIPMAMACRAIGHGVVIGIDPWSSSASIEGMSGQDLEWWKAVPHDRIYHEFTQRIETMQLTNIVSIIRKKSDDVKMNEQIGLLHIDGNHSEQALRDVYKFAPLVARGGLVFCDDVAWAGGGVSKAVERLISMGFTKRFDIDTGALFYRGK